MSRRRRRHAFNADRPIQRRGDDEFDRAPFAGALAAQIRALPKNECHVLAVTGPWGSGKSSVLNLVKKGLSSRSFVVVEFNPWLFAGTEDLLVSFFSELMAQLGESGKSRFRRAISAMTPYARIAAGMLPGPAGEVAKKAVESAGSAFGQKRSAAHLKKEADERLRVVDRRVVVVVDDIDRLEAGEIRDLVRVIRLVADFPNITYLLSFDRGRVEKALGNGKRAPGRAYLEKIIQSIHDLPVIRRSQLERFLEARIARAIEGRPLAPFHQREWQDIFAQVVLPLMLTPRDVLRYTNMIPLALQLAGDEVAVEDVLALTAVQCLLPDAFVRIAQAVQPLTFLSQYRGPYDSTRDLYGQTVRAIADADDLPPDDPRRGFARSVKYALFRLLFPATQQYLDSRTLGDDLYARWRADRRVAHADVLNAFLEKGIPSGTVPTRVVREILEAFPDPAELARRLASLDVDELENVLRRLTDFAASIAVDDLVTGLPALVEQGFRLPEQGFLHRNTLMRLIIREFILAVPADGRESVVQHLLLKTASLSARHWIFAAVDTLKDEVDRPLHAGLVERLRSDLRSEFVRQSPHDLAKEVALDSLAWHLFPDEATRGPLRVLCERDDVLLALLATALQAVPGDESRPAAERFTLPWTDLLDLLGADFLVSRVSGISSDDQRSEREGLALEIAREFAARKRTLPVRGAPAAGTPGNAAIFADLQSEIPATRRRAYTSLEARSSSDGPVVGPIAGELLRIAFDAGFPAAERAQVLRILNNLGPKEEARTRALEAWFDDATLPDAVSGGIASLFHDDGTVLLLKRLDDLDPAACESPDLQLRLLHALGALNNALSRAGVEPTLCSEALRVTHKFRRFPDATNILDQLEANCRARPLPA